jgi:hypothetical protein
MPRPMQFLHPEFPFICEATKVECMYLDKGPWLMTMLFLAMLILKEE